jgi:hypothetical protein
MVGQSEIAGLAAPKSVCPWAKADPESGAESRLIASSWL